ncbi:hypothetical protein Bpfe_029509, partial [Biomphalaria pfeifferi]
ACLIPQSEPFPCFISLNSQERVISPSRYFVLQNTNLERHKLLMIVGLDDLFHEEYNLL